VVDYGSRSSLRRDSVSSPPKGFTLIEIAIVLVIIGLLIGGVLKGQELITSARVRNLIAQQDGIKAAFFGFQDRYRALPGDYAAASVNINCTTPCADGDGDGLILEPNLSGVYESIIAWHHLSAAGFLNGSYSASSTVTTPPTDANTPKNSFGTFLQLIYDGAYGDPGASHPKKHNLKTGNQVSVEIIAEADRKIDDGRPTTGVFQFSEYEPTGTGNPQFANCTQGGSWNISGGEGNCGGASLF